VLAWAAERLVCPGGVASLSWKRYERTDGGVPRAYVAIHFPQSGGEERGQGARDGRAQGLGRGREGGEQGRRRAVRWGETDVEA
jgi:hypothetical protein